MIKKENNCFVQIAGTYKKNVFGGNCNLAPRVFHI